MITGSRAFSHPLHHINSQFRRGLSRGRYMSTYKSPYESIRSKLDYNYHSKTPETRLIVQDDFMTKLLSRPYSTSESPILLFTAGAMGAGKSHYLSTLPYKFILIDPDEIAATLPHYDTIGTSFQQGSDKLRNLERGTRLRHEARLITEILLHESMRRSLDIVLDGSLRSYQWYLGEIIKLRTLFPNYRTELVHVHAPLAHVLQRAAKREQATGREVPAPLIERSWKDSRRAISVLGRSKIVDRVQMVDSSGATPVLIYDSDTDPNWIERGVPSAISPVDGFLDKVIENGEDVLKDTIRGKI